MRIFKAFGDAIAAIAVLIITAAPLVGAMPAEARRAVAACGPRGCGAAACGPRGCAATGTHRPAHGAARRGVVVVQPHRYWRPGGAIAAGAAIGFVAGASATAIAGNPPQPGQCWYYTSPAKTTGFWDVCPK
ncbi:hypothetical protein [Ochrobactrum sp. RH2CCR150]|uniref:hypothetical protein n=1 Tax=Ochrobactrum sp. RH2CCR150 TaxID=2587044 RepID=UPI003670E626